MAKLWSGRTGGITAQAADDFNASIRFDSRMFRQDIRGSMAHAAMLGARGILSDGDTDALLSGLEGILRDLESGALSVDPAAEDIHMFVEQELTKRIGEAGKKLHTARSRNDQVALDLRLYLREECDTITALLADAIFAFLRQAEQHSDTIMPGYTHLQRAQPITFGHHLTAYVMMLLRDMQRLRDCRGRINQSPIGWRARPIPPTVFLKRSSLAFPPWHKTALTESLTVISARSCFPASPFSWCIFPAFPKS